MFSYVWPLALVVISNVFYQICAKAMPKEMNAFAAMTITYLVGAAASLVFYFFSAKDANLLREYSKVNWAPFMLGIMIIGLEAGFIYTYKAGWQISTASIVQSAFLAVILIFVGLLLYREALTWNKIVGVAICLIGLAFINYR